MYEKGGEKTVQPYMRKTFKNYLMGLLKLKHSHLDPFTKQPSMKEALSCKQCGTQVLRAQELYNRYRRQHPEWFMYKKPEFVRSEKLEKGYDLLSERIQKDPIYREHIRRLAHGTEAEKDEEIKKANEQYYQTHYAEEGGSVKEVKT